MNDNKKLENPKIIKKPLINKIRSYISNFFITIKNIKFAFLFFKCRSTPKFHKIKMQIS